ncbi:DNA repair protein rhp42 [Teratosphaeria destructans]|uniref:DNA repair protein rhp42 n=1 Tax=Teratosphaeria destructans TaxID=418781 RepID=A0A9W7W412_9PEZI|nr:DNA repair protein rhp42 [Teratosphaeria destructans]
MPPFVSRKRHRSSSSSVATPLSTSKKPAAKNAKSTVFDSIDAPGRKEKGVSQSKKLLEELNDDEEESLSEAESDEFEDVPPAKKRKVAATKGNEEEEDDDDDDDDDDDIDWEDAISARQAAGHDQPEPEIGDISLTITDDCSYVDPGVSIPGVSKKGPSKRERIARHQAHCLHVQALMWHNTVRNSWLNDQDVQQTLVHGLSEGVKREVTRWREAMGKLSKEELEEKKAAAATKSTRGKRGKKGRDKHGRDWNHGAQHAEQGVPNMSAGDPLLRLLKVLTAYWRKRFSITAPGIRKQGYMPLRRLRDEIKAWMRDRSDAESHGERIEDRAEFRKLAKECEGSRDVGAQLFVALLRGVGIETRMVANLQPSGFGWSKAEEAVENKAKKVSKLAVSEGDEVQQARMDSEATPRRAVLKKGVNAEASTRVSSRTNKAEIINLDSDSSVSSAPSDDEAEIMDVDSDGSVVDVTPAAPKRKANMKYDRDMAFPNYWVEACSPATHKYIPVDPIVLSTIASNEELLQSFEPRGRKAENAKQVMAYTAAFSADGSAKDVTVRYLKKHQLPGKTKGVRMPAEKVPVYNRKGKVKKYEEYDWFRTVMSIYDKPEKQRNAADELEDQTDLKPFRPAKEEKEVEKESLQWYKQSAEYVIEQHLRREEAILPGAKPVKTFTAGKGDKAKEHPVYRRADVVPCKTVESWHKEGRGLREGEHPMKLVPMRAVTLIRKREMEDALKETGEKLKQGLYSIDQTDWIIPPPIENGVIPKNAFGNMDVYVPTMVPEGAVHLPLKGSAKICRKLEVDYAEACTGFEFGKQRAVPVLTGVVVAEEHEVLVRDAWKEAQAEQKRKEDTKRTGVALHWWRKMLLGLRVIERMQAEYQDLGGNEEEINPFVRKAQREGRSVHVAKKQAPQERDQDGGFFLPGHEERGLPQTRAEYTHEVEDDQRDADMGGGFLVEEGAVDDDLPSDGGFLADDADEDEKTSTRYAPITPVSLQSLHKMDGQEESGEDDKVGNAEVDLVPARKSAPKSSQRSGRKPQPEDIATRRKSKILVEDDSKLSESHSGDEEATFHSDSTANYTDVQTPRGKKGVSPEVVVTPAKASGWGPRSSRSRASGPDRGRGRGRTATKRATPTRSQYFSSSQHAAEQRDDSAEQDEDEDEEDESEVEVVRPSRTTARTRAQKRE